MCDTMWKQTTDGIIFAKNSDRACNEPNLTVFFEGGKREEKQVKCTYISIPQVSSVNSVLLVKPSWMWGAEMGINDKWVTIGNEAVFTKSKGKKEEKLLGMDMLRLALERSDSAKSALSVIIGLLTKYGQGGNCGYGKSFYYDNSFLITDAAEGYILETAGTDYTVTKLKDAGNISNRLTAGEFFDVNSEPVFTYFSGSAQREKKACEDISRAQSLSDAFAAMRSHVCGDKKLFTKGSVKSVCMHQSLLGDHTTGSMAVRYGKTPSIWITGSSAPCLSVFKPVIFGQSIPPVFFAEDESLEYWKTREYLNRAIFCGHIDAKAHREKAMLLEKGFIDGYDELNNRNAKSAEIAEFCRECAKKEQAFIDGYSDIIEAVKSGSAKLTGRWKKKTKAF